MEQIQFGMPEEARLCVPEWDTSFSSDASEDLVLPDYYPEIRRVITVITKALPESRFLSGRALEISGTVSATVLYLGEDGAVSAVNTGTEYTASAALPGESVNLPLLSVDTRVESDACRVVGPRKLTLKYRLRHRLMSEKTESAAEETEYEDGSRTEGADVPDLELRMKTVSSAFLSRGSLTAGISGTVRDKAGMRPVFCWGDVRVSEARAEKNGIAVRGEAVIRCLFDTSDGGYVTISAREPFEEVIPAEGAEAGDMARAVGRVAAITLSPDEKAAGEYPFEAELDLEGESMRTVSVQATDDAYSVRCAAETEMREADVLSPVRCGVGSLSVSGRGPIRQGETGSVSLLGLWADPAAENGEIRDGRLYLSGTCRVKAMLAGGGEVWCEEFPVPFRYECEGAAGRDLLWRCDVAVSELVGRIEDGGVSVHLELNVGVWALGRERVRRVSLIRLHRDQPTSREDGLWHLSYPAEGERLWDIAKRYRADLRETARENGIGPDDLPQGPVLLRG